MPKPHVVSNSEVNTWNECPRKYYYSYDLKLEKIGQGPARSVGNVGHAVLQRYFEFLKDNPGKFFEAGETALAFLGMWMSEMDSPTELEAANKVFRVLSQYFTHFALKHPLAKVLEVEKYYQQDLTDEFSYGMTLDLLLQDGSFLYVVDHKFTYDFWRQTKVDTKGAAQIVKYYFVLKLLGFEVDEVMINEIRYRERHSRPYTFEEMFREDTWKPSSQATRQLMIDQVRISRKIIEHRNMPLEERERDAIRSLGSAACEFCDYSSLCIGELNGADIEPDIETYFQRKTYDYNKSEDGYVVGADGDDIANQTRRDY